MKINLEVLHSCTIKRKKPWPKLSWIGKDKEQLLILDSQRVSLIDPKNGKTKRKVSKLSSLMKTMIAYNISDNGIYFVGIVAGGDLIVWNKDKDKMHHIAGMKEFEVKLNFQIPSVFVSDDVKKIVLITSRGKVFVWEANKSFENNDVNIDGNWSGIAPPNEIKIVEDHKESVCHARFNINSVDGMSATVCFVFNFEKRLIINTLRIRWLNLCEITSSDQSRFETLWISHQPATLGFLNTIITDNDASNFSCLHTRGAYIIKLSHSADILALACNQKHVENTSIVYYSPANGAVHPVNLRNFGLNSKAKGRHYWIQDLVWMSSDLYLAGITKHGAIFLLSRLGQPLIIHAIGKEINMGPALYLTIHPLIMMREKTSTSTSQNRTSDDASLASTAENDDNLRQRYSITFHPSLPILSCSDGYLMCVMRIQTAFSTQSRLIRELMNETIGLLDSVSETIDRNSSNYRINFLAFREDDENKSFEKSTLRPNKAFTSTDNLSVPDWGLNTALAGSQAGQSDKSSDSGVDSNEGKNRHRSDSIQSQKIAEGKIIFSFLPQIMQISSEVLKTGTVVNKMESAFEHLQSSWTLLVSTPTLKAYAETYECDQTAKAIQQSFTHFSYLFLIIDSANLKQFQIYSQEFKNLYGSKIEAASPQDRQDLETKFEEEFKMRVLVDLFLKMLKFLFFDPASRFNPNSHMIIYVPRFVEKFLQSLLKFDNTFVGNSAYAQSRTKLFHLIYSLLNTCETLIKNIYKFKQNDSFFLNSDPILSQKQLLPVVKHQKTVKIENPDTSQQANTNSEGNKDNKIESVTVETDSLDVAGEKEISIESVLLTKKNKPLLVDFGDFIFEKSWINLKHYVFKYRDTLDGFGKLRQKQIKDLDLFILLLERRLNSLPALVRPIPVTTEMNKFENIKFTSIIKRKRLFKINKADLIYLNYGNLDAALDEWLTQLSYIFEDINSTNSSNVHSLVQKSIKISHKIFYACLGSYKISKLINIINKYFINEQYGNDDSNTDSNSRYSPFNMVLSTFKYMQPYKPLVSAQISIICLLKSLARFMALYLTNSEQLFICSIQNPVIMPSIIGNYNSKPRNEFKIELSREKLTNCINNKQSIINSVDGLPALSLTSFFTPDKTLELFLVTGLYDEAIFFLNLINDWKSSFLISSILRESKIYEQISDVSMLPDDMRLEQALSIKLCSLLGVDNLIFNNKIQNSKSYLQLMEKSHLDSVCLILKELLMCAVMTKTNVLEPLLTKMIELLISFTEELCSNSIIVPDDFYLPAQPIYLAQMFNDENDKNNHEMNLRIKLHVITKCIITLLMSSNLHVPLIKWYLEQTIESNNLMRDNYAIITQFKPNLQLKNLLTSIRYQKIGNTPQHLLYLFRDFCSILFFLDIRDRFSLLLREYSNYFMKSQFGNKIDLTVDAKMCEEIIEYGNLVLSFRSFFKEENHIEIQDIIISKISRLSVYAQNDPDLIQELRLEYKLATCLEKRPFSMIDKEDLSTTNLSSLNSERRDSNNQINFWAFESKVIKLLELWKTIESGEVNGSMADAYQEIILASYRVQNQKISGIFGRNEDSLKRIYLEKCERSQPNISGSYDTERSAWLADFLEMFFNIGFDQTEHWESMIQSVNQTPLLPEFYEIIRQKELPKNDAIEKQYIMKPEIYGEKKSTSNSIELDVLSSRKRRLSLSSSVTSRKKVIDENDVNVEIPTRYGLFRAYSVKSLKSDVAQSENLDDTVNMKLRKSVSFSNMNDQLDDNENQETQIFRNEQSLKIIDYGNEYVSTSNLAIWLIQWSVKFQKILLNSSNRVPWLSTSNFWYSTIGNSWSKVTLKLDSLNANMLVGCVYLADGNNLDSLSVKNVIKMRLTGRKVRNSAITKPSKQTDNEDEITQVSALVGSARNTRRETRQLKKTPKPGTSNTKDDNSSSNSTTLDISSFTDNQIKNYFSKLEEEGVKKIVAEKKQRMRNKQSSVESAYSITDSEIRNSKQASPVRKISDPATERKSSINQAKSVDESLESTLLASDFYNLNNTVKPLPFTTSPNQNISQAIIDATRIENNSPNKSLNETSNSKVNAGGFLANLFKRNSSRSPSGSKSPVKTSASPSPTKNIDRQQLIRKFEQENSIPAVQYQQQSTGSITDLIRNELKKIVQIQHDTIMNFLNDGQVPVSSHSFTPNKVMPLTNNIDQQISSILKQQQFQMPRSNSQEQPVEFIIETKIKAVDSKGGIIQSNQYPNMLSSAQMNSKMLPNETVQIEQENYFMKSFSNIQLSAIHTQKQTVKKSKFINIPLLQLNSQENINLPYISQPVSQPARDQRFFDPVQDLPSVNKSVLSQQVPNVQSKIMNIPLLNLSSNSYTNTAPVPEKISMKPGPDELNKHIKEFAEKSVKKEQPLSAYKDLPLLRLNYNSQPTEQHVVQDNFNDPRTPTPPASSIATSIAPKQKSEDRSVSNASDKQVSKETQVQKPMYDGYLIKPGVFEDMLEANAENERISASSAQAHYDSTKHLRENSEQTKLKNKKDTYTSTDGLQNADPIPPDILFKLKFDSKRNDRQEDGDVGLPKDFISVVDLNGSAAEEILKLIEIEQNRRSGKYVPIVKDKKPKLIPSKSNDFEKTIVDDKNEDPEQEKRTDVQDQTDIEDKPTRDTIGGDSLTGKLLRLSKSEDDWRKYDEIMNKQIEEATKQAGLSVSKQRIANEFKYIDEKIKLMNEMANEMDYDYNRYNKIIKDLDDLTKQREAIERYQDTQSRHEEEEEKRRVAIKNKEESKIYHKQDADILIEDLKRKVLKPTPRKEEKSKKSEMPIIRPKPTSVKITPRQPSQNSDTSKRTEKSKSPQVSLDNRMSLEDEDLSDLKEEEEARLKQILKKSTDQMSLSQTANSVTNILRDVFEEMNVDSVDDLDSDKLDEILEASNSTKPRVKKQVPPSVKPSTSPSRKVIQSKKPINQTKTPKAQVSDALNKLKPTTSPVRSRKDQNKLTQIENLEPESEPVEKPSKPLNRTYDKTFRKVSPVVKKEQEMSNKRDVLHEKFTQQREQEAKQLLQDILVENEQNKQVIRNQSKDNLTPRSPASSRKHISPSPSRQSVRPSNPSPPIPVPPLKLDPKPIDSEFEKMKSEVKKPSLMARSIMELKKKEQQKQNETERLLKELELRASLVGQSLNESTTSKPAIIIKPFTDYVHLQEPNKLREEPDHKPLTYGQQLKMHQETTVVQQTNPYKVFGSHRVPGIYKSYVKQSPRQTKTYSERVKELKPAESQAIIKSTSSFGNLSTRGSSIGSKSTQNRPVKTYGDQLKQLQSNRIPIKVAKPKFNTRHNLVTKARIDMNAKKRNMNQANRFTPYKSVHQGDELEKIEDLSSWSLDDKMKQLLYDEPKKGPKNFGNLPKKTVTYKDTDQDTLADTDGDNLLEDLMRDQEENDRIYENALRDLDFIEKKEKGANRKSSIINDGDDYVNQVDIDDLYNISLSSESALTSYLDWDQIDQIIETAK